MKIFFEHQGKNKSADLSRPIDISIPLEEGEGTVNCFYAPLMETFPVVAGDFVGSTAQGGPLNFLNVRLNPHGNGTHTECVGHIAKEKYTINKCLTKFWFTAEVISVFPERMEGDKVITLDRIKDVFEGNGAEAIIIRTLPNDDLKLKTDYSGSNPTYVSPDAIQYLLNQGIEHLLIDLPSVDREEDGGALASHKAFWNYPEKPQSHRTITELVYVPTAIKDGTYLLNIQIASFEIDVSPSKPVLYRIHED